MSEATMWKEGRRLANVLSPYANGEWAFTGTRAGLTPRQSERLRAILSTGRPAIIRHGGAPGADHEFHAIWREELPRRFADVWPADQNRVKLFDGQDNVNVQRVMPPLDRNEEIVKRSAFLVAAPKRQVEEIRSGTWATIRCARRLHKPVLVVWPDGQMTLKFEDAFIRVTMR